MRADQHRYHQNKPTPQPRSVGKTDALTNPELLEEDGEPNPVEDVVEEATSVAETAETPEVVVAQPKVISKSEAKLRYNLDQMKVALTTQTGIISELALRRYAETHSAVCKTLVSENNTELFDIYLQYHVEHKNTYCSEQRGLSGLTALRRQDHDRVSLVYHIFRTIALGGNVATLDAETCIRIFGGNTAIMAYISKKLDR